MVRRGCERNVITYSSLISACEKAGRWELALELFREMHAEGCRPNVVTFNSLIAACAQGERGGPRAEGCPADDEERAEPAARLGGLCRVRVPGGVRYAPHASLAAARRPLPSPPGLALPAGAQWEKAQELFEQMQHRGCKPDAVTFGGLIAAYDRAGKPDTFISWPGLLDSAFSERAFASGAGDAVLFGATTSALADAGAPRDRVPVPTLPRRPLAPRIDRL